MTRTFAELPWHVVPFLFGMFALVEALQQGGWVDFFAGVRTPHEGDCVKPSLASSSPLADEARSAVTSTNSVSSCSIELCNADGHL